MKATYALVIPKTFKSGPGHRSHLRPVGMRKSFTLCGLEKNGVRVEAPPWRCTPGDVEHCIAEADRVSCRRLCANCIAIARKLDLRAGG